MAIVDYDPATDRYLVFDPAPGQGSNYNSINRRYLTTAAGDWKTPAQLSTGYLAIDNFWLYSKK